MLRVRIHLARQRGVSLVELMVGITVGLLVVAGASLLVSSQLTENRRLLLETQVQQDLRATADIIARELRRAGHWRRAEAGVASTSNGAAVRNDYMSVGSIGNTQCSGLLANFDICFNYLRPLGLADADVNGAPRYTFGYRLTGGVIKTKLSTSAESVQDLTDVKVLEVRSFTIELNDAVSDANRWVLIPCPKLCPPNALNQVTTDCWPRVAMRDATITITGRAVSDHAVQRTVVSRVRLRNDQVQFRAGDVADRQACPA